MNTKTQLYLCALCMILGIATSVLNVASAQSQVLIIDSGVEGSGPPGSDSLIDTRRRIATFGFQTFRDLGFSSSDIIYLVNDSSIANADGLANLASVFSAFAGVPPTTKDVFVFIVAHGGSTSIRLNSSESLLFTDLSDLVIDLQQRVTGKVTMLVGSCFGGGLLSTFQARSAGIFPTWSSGTWVSPTIMTAAGEDNPSYYIARGSVSFEMRFLEGLLARRTVSDAFTVAAGLTQVGIPIQTPLIDANANGTSGEAQDFSWANYVITGF